MFNCIETRNIRGCGEQGVIPATPLDINYKNIRLQPIFVYRSSLSPDTLTSALKKALIDFPVVCGGISRENTPEKSINQRTAININSGGGSVVLTIQSSSLSLKDVNDELTVQKHINRLAQPVVAIESSQNEPIMRLTLTFLNDGGSVLGVEASHLIMDGRSFYAFFQRVSDVISNTSSTTPVLERKYLGNYIENLRNSIAIHNEHERKLTFREKSLLVRTGLRYLFSVKLSLPVFSTKTFQISKEFVRQERISKEVSTQDIVTAYIVCLLSRSVKSPKDQSFVFTYLQDIRGMKDIDVPETYFGNGVVGRNLPIEAKKLKTMSISDTAIVFRESIQSLSKSTVDDIFLNHLKLDQNVFSLVDYFNRGINVTISNWSRFPVKSLDFGSGLPVSYETTYDKEPMIRTIKILPVIGKQEFWKFRLCLPFNEMRRFCKLHDRTLANETHRLHKPTLEA